MTMYDRTILDQFAKAKEYHFLDMHVYVNALFRDWKIAEDKHAYRHYDVRPAYFSKDHHVHIYLWKLNTDMDNFIEMFKFIGEVNKIVSRPVYIHIPKRVRYENEIFVRYFVTILEDTEYEGNKLRYVLILEKNSNVTEYRYGDYIPIPDQKYGHMLFRDARLLVNWDPRGYARPMFYSRRNKMSKSGFNE